jgi:Cu(I)/Ag(I) efflux system membrane fusion protein
VTTPSRIERQPRRRTIVLAVVVVLVIVAVWAIVARGSSREAKGGAASAPGKGTAGMPGMTASGNGTVQLTADQIRQFGITFGSAEVRPLIGEARTTGVIALDETRLAQVTAKIGGYVERLYVNATGQSVMRGQPMLELYSPDLMAAQQELLLSGQLQRDMGRSAVPGVPGSTTDLIAASRRRLQLLDISEQQIDDIIRTGRVRRTLTLYAPVSGIVTDKKVIQGQAIMAGAALFTIVDLSNVWIDVQLREADASAVRVGTGADVQVAGLPERTLKGTVAFVYPMLDSATRTVRARVTVANPGGGLKPGMYATIHLATPGRSALTVPSTAVLRTGERDVVFMDIGKGAIKPMDVRVGRVAGDYTEILSGLEPGSRVVTSAQFLLDSESNLGEVMQSMIGQGGASAASTSGSGDMRGMPMPAPVSPKR